MNLGVSNLAWDPAVDEAALELLAARGFEGVEVAPTRIAPWADLTTDGIAAYRGKLQAAGRRVSSLQAIFYGRTEAQLLGDTTEFAAMRDHLHRVADIAAQLGAGVAVFGAPGNRRRGAMPMNDAYALAAERLRQLGDIVAQAGLILALEPVPPQYGSDFLMHATEVAHLVSLCQHPAIGVHLDCACIALAGDDAACEIRALGSRAVHYHAAEPDLGPFACTLSDHPGAAQALRDCNYPGWVVIEMRQQGEDGLAALATALALVATTYR